MPDDLWNCQDIDFTNNLRSKPTQTLNKYLHNSADVLFGSPLTVAFAVAWPSWTVQVTLKLVTGGGGCCCTPDVGNVLELLLL